MPTNFIAIPHYKCHIINRQTAMLNGATGLYTFGSKLHNVSFVLNCVPWSLINHCLNNVIKYSLKQLQDSTKRAFSYLRPINITFYSKELTFLGKAHRYNLHTQKRKTG